MKILSIYPGHCSTVAYLKDGEIIDCISEEKFNNIKNSLSFPLKSIKWILKKNNLNINDFDKIGIVGKTTVFYDIRTSENNSFESVLNEKENLLKKIYRYIDVNLKFETKENILKKLQLKKYNKNFPRRKKYYFRKIMELLELKDENKLELIDHHECHAFGAYYGLKNNVNNALVFTLDGQGDFSCAKIYKVVDNQWTLLANTWWKYSIGELYSSVTKVMGMKPLEHEYKIMGLAAYSNKKYFQKAKKDIFEGLFWLEGLEFRSKIPSYAFSDYLSKKIPYHRFDNIAGALQDYLEELVIEWIKKAIKKTGIKNIYLGGGVFMNVKLNKKIQELPEVENVNFMPSCGDESTPIGGAYYLYNKYKSIPKPFKNIYFGISYTNDEIEEFIKSKKLENRFKVEFVQDIEKRIATLLSENKIVARFRDRCEWGARSLGNRAILGNPSRMETFFEINDRIKQRDFWMPFAPTILDKYAKLYLKNPKNIKAPYMITAFDSTELGREKFKAAMHQRDKTLRAQILEKEFNEKYYNLIEYFYELTGIGGVLNTSFNLHGYPLVATPEQALFTFENSNLEYLALENFLIIKKK
ncbi:carbamoyltransferase C-terminal domain-containing protein [Caminibacter pacificus]|uniref:Carbamoyltransferase n=1 Tax=Caminibacter pacificus TaxID=1424653 RepID=A0AAJ4RBT4_9BACT|nr:carbamoyltransferase C-terminal domain-containing protein [Caminibacter pacificus]ROR39159.1 carbamoyltransferase [Caminibacter pacificus]